MKKKKKRTHSLSHDEILRIGYGFKSINMYTSGFFNVEIKLPSNYDVTGVCVTLYVSTQINVYDFF